jgi:hypothetical protein
MSEKEKQTMSMGMISWEIPFERQKNLETIHEIQLGDMSIVGNMAYPNG